MNSILLDKYEGFIFDLDGTIYRGNELLPGARKVIEQIKEAGNKKHVFLSNKPIARRENYAEKLTRLGIETSCEQVINSSYVTADYLQKNLPKSPVYVIGELSLIEEIEEAGLEVVNKNREEFARSVVQGSTTSIDYLNFQQENYDYEDINCLIISFDRTFHYGKLNDALQIIHTQQDEIEIIATNPDTTCPIAGGEVPDAASMIAAVEAASEKKIDKIMGKPSEQMIRTAIEAMGFNYQLDDNKGEDPEAKKSANFLMIGDRLETDIKMGLKAGLDTAAVLSGVIDHSTIKASDLNPDYVLTSVRELMD